MTKISLRAYDREIEGLIQHDQQPDEAIAHCRQILKTFPKHLETYRLLGKAYLEAKRHREAVDIFERVLLVAPEDFVSHVGMSIIADEQGGLDDAIWHMERAFEVQPSNAAIQAELQRLFGRRDGVEPPKIRLTRGALARMYMQGELYSQAISEIRAVLGADSKRTDMQTLLAKACYLNGQKSDAASISTDVLSRQPYCLDANRLMAEILAATQRAEAAQEYRQRVIELDPYAAFVTDSLFRSENVADGAVNLERLEYSGPVVEGASAFGLGTGAERLMPGHPRTEPEWLSSGGAPQPTPGLDAAKPAQHAPELPDFLKEAGWGPRTSDDSAGAILGADEEPSEPAAVPASLPDWVQAFAPADSSASETQEEQAAPVDTPDWLAELGSAPSPETPASAPMSEASAEIPDWLRELGGRDVDEPAVLPEAPAEAEAEPAQPEETPSWLKDFASDLETPLPSAAAAGTEIPAPSSGIESEIGSLGTTEQEQDDALAWLEGLAAKHGAKPEELVTNPEARSETAPEWVDKAREMAESKDSLPKSEQPVPSGEPVQSDLDLTGKWLSSLQEAEPAEVHPLAAGETQDKGEVLDWISKLTEQGDFTERAVGPETGAEPGVGSEEPAPWMEETISPAAGQPNIDEVPEWLGRATAKPESKKPAPSAPAPASAEVDLPEWLAGLDEEQDEAESIGQVPGDVPPWLRPESESMPKSAEPTHPADWRPAETSPAPAPEAVSASPLQGTPEPPLSSEGIGAHEAELEGESVAPPKARAIQVAAKTIGGATSLEGAQAELGRGNIAAALNLYERLIRKGKSLEEIIRDLRDALYRYPVEIPIWQALGDAYMRANRLQEALDAYTKAEELLR